MLLVGTQLRSRNSVNWWLVGLGILTRDWCEFVEYRFCLNHKFGFKYIDNFLVKAFSNWCIYSVYSLIISKIDPVLTNIGGYASSQETWILTLCVASGTCAPTNSGSNLARLPGDMLRH